MKSNQSNQANIWIFPLQFSEQRRPSHCRKRLQLLSLFTVDFDLRTSILIWLGDNWLSKILLVDFYKYSTLKESHSHGFPKELMSKLRHSSGSWVVAALLRRSRTLSWDSPLSWYQLDWCLQFRPRKPEYLILIQRRPWFVVDLFLFTVFFNPIK